MIKTSSDINKKVMKRLKKRAHYDKRTLSEGREIIMGINKACLEAMKNRDIMDFGLFILFPNRDTIYKRMKHMTRYYAKLKRLSNSSSDIDENTHHS